MTLLQNIEKDIQQTEKELQKFKFSWKLVERLSLLTAQKEEIEKGIYMKEKRRYKEYYQEIVYFKDGTCYAYSAPYVHAI